MDGGRCGGHERSFFHGQTTFDRCVERQRLENIYEVHYEVLISLHLLLIMKKAEERANGTYTPLFFGLLLASFHTPKTLFTSSSYRTSWYSEVFTNNNNLFQRGGWRVCMRAGPLGSQDND